MKPRLSFLLIRDESPLICDDWMLSLLTPPHLCCALSRDYLSLNFPCYRWPIGWRQAQQAQPEQ
jgi:hypothetical protein